MANAVNLTPFSRETSQLAARKSVEVRQAKARFRAGLPMDEALQFRICRHLNRTFLKTINMLDRELDPGKRLKHALTLRAIRETWHLVSNTPFPGVYRHRPDKAAKQLLPMPIDAIPAELATNTATNDEQPSQPIDSQQQSLGCKPADDLPY